MSEREITGLTLLAAYYLAVGTIVNAFKVDLESSNSLPIELEWQKESRQE